MAGKIVSLKVMAAVARDGCSVKDGGGVDWKDDSG
ncbi:hypothetical protein A2U01_0027600, partial [Trifolium medium]|nr:hypothetical protein [Trifolium medium]